MRVHTNVVQPRPVYGVDFSGASMAGRKIWIARGVPAEHGLRLEACYRAQELPDGGPQRTAALTALRQLIAREGDTCFGLDFPFGLPRSLVEEPDWEAFIARFAERFSDARHFRSACIQAAGGRELKRLTDRESQTPFCCYNLRLYRQTYYGLREVLAPLVRDGLACVLPMQAARPGRAWLLEICPASALKQYGLYRPYKGRGAAQAAARQQLVVELEGQGVLLDDAQRRAVVDDCDGDALDSLIAAWSVWRALQRPAGLAVNSHPAYGCEGYVYV